MITTGARCPLLGLALVATVTSCVEAPLAIDDMPCPSTGTALAYATFAQPFFAEHCNTCHSSSTHGAPASYQFDNLDDIRRHRDRIFIRAAGPNTSMPPGPEDPPADERDQLAEWLACGAS